MGSILAVCFVICILGAIVGVGAYKKINEDEEMMYHDEDIWDDDDN